jgi:hypothetical protein
MMHLPMFVLSVAKDQAQSESCKAILAMADRVGSLPLHDAFANVCSVAKDQAQSESCNARLAMAMASLSSAGIYRHAFGFVTKIELGKALRAMAMAREREPFSACIAMVVWETLIDGGSGSK